MCNWRYEAESISMKMGGVPIENYFSGDVTSNVPPEMAEPGKCLVPSCHARLHWQHISQGRYLCDHCFILVTRSDPYSNCLMCGRPLDYNSVQAQANRPRELQYAVHGGECADYHRALAGVVLGIIPPARRLLPETTGTKVP